MSRLCLKVCCVIRCASMCSIGLRDGFQAQLMQIIGIAFEKAQAGKPSLYQLVLRDQGLGMFRV